MKLYALPENVLSELITTLQELPYKSVSKLLLEVSKARLVIDENKNPVELPPEAPQTTDTASQAV